MSLLYLIDGCNVINHKSFLQGKRKTVQDSRMALLDLIKSRELVGSPRNRCIVVFDGYPPRTGYSYERKGAVSAVFSFDDSADDKIMKLLRQGGNPKNIVVVSDDKQIVSFARLHNAAVSSVDEFLKISIEPAQQKAARRAEEDAKLNYTQADKINRELKKLWLDS